MVVQTFSSSIVDSDFLKDKLSPTTKRLLGQLLDETEEDYQEFKRDESYEFLLEWYEEWTKFETSLSDETRELLQLMKTEVNI